MHEFMQSIRSALEPTITEECLIYTKDWWSYELCPGSVVKQFHMEGRNAVFRRTMILC